MSKVQVDVVTPSRTVFEGQAEMVIAKGLEGELGVQAGHIPMVTPLEISPLKLQTEEGKTILVAVSGGFLEVRPDKVTVLAESAELADEIDAKRAQRAKEQAEQQLKEIDNKHEDFAVYADALKRADMRLQIVAQKV